MKPSRVLLTALLTVPLTIAFGVMPAEAVVATQNFDGVVAPALPAGWSATGGPDLWVTSTANPDTAPNSARVTHSGAAVIDDSSLQSPLLAPLGATQLQFRQSFAFDDFGGCYDGGVLEVSQNGGPFQDITVVGGSFSAGGYNGALNGLENNPLGARPGWCSSSGGYITTTAFLPATLVHPLRFRWRFGSGFDFQSLPWDVDTVTVWANQPPVANDDNGGVVTIDQNPTTTTNVLNNDSDPDSTLSATGTVTVVGTASDGGTPVVNGDKTITYTATGNVIGPVTYTYQVCDNQTPNQCDTAVVTITVTTSLGACTVSGTNGGQTVQGTNGNDVICGLGGNDTIQGLGGDDLIIGGSGKDLIQGGAGNDSMYGLGDNDTIQGGTNTGPGDFANGGQGNDVCQQNESQTSCP